MKTNAYADTGTLPPSQFLPPFEGAKYATLHLPWYPTLINTDSRTLEMRPVDDKEKLNDEQESRRAFVKKAVYVPPSILTLQAAPAYAKYGSEKPGGDNGKDEWYEDKDEKKAKDSSDKKGKKDD